MADRSAPMRSGSCISNSHDCIKFQCWLRLEILLIVLGKLQEMLTANKRAVEFSYGWRVAAVAKQSHNPGSFAIVAWTDAPCVWVISTVTGFPNNTVFAPIAVLS